MDRPTPRRLVVLGSTGSIGTNCLDVVEHLPDRLQVAGLSTHSRWELLCEQARHHRPRWVTVTDGKSGHRAEAASLPHGCELLYGADGIARMVADPEVDIVVTAIVGAAGLHGTWAALEAGKTVAVANKETLVLAGALVTDLARRRGGRLLPVDSEHSAIFQAMQGNPSTAVERVVLTASGGPFRGKSRSELAHVTPEQALRHPTWRMGPKITIDSATLMNKALEVIEARWLFDLEPEQIEVIIHPESVIHSFVEFKDGSVLAQLSPPDMRLPIQYALTYPDRVAGPARRLSWQELSAWHFEQPDHETFPAVQLGYEVARRGGTCGAVLNAANEAAVERFLAGELGFLEIPRACRAALDHHDFSPTPTLAELAGIDRWAREGGRPLEQPHDPNRPDLTAPASPPPAEAPPAEAPPLTPIGWLVQNGPYLVLMALFVGWIHSRWGVQGVLNAGLVVLGLGFVIFIHELGHFLAAKWCDVHVTTFSIGFGPALPGCSYQKGETTYKVAILPLGGYVNMVGEGPEADEQEDYPRSFKNKTVGQRMLIISAGVIMNVILGCVCFIIVYLNHGVDRPPAVVWTVDSGSPSWKDGVRTGWVIKQIGDNTQPFFEDLRMAVAFSSKNEKIPFVFAPRSGDGPPIEIAIEPRADPNDNVPIIGIAPPRRLELWPAIAAKVRPAPVLSNSAAAAARAVDLLEGDELVAATDPADPTALAPLTGTPAARLSALSSRMRDARLKGKPIRLDLKRAGAVVTVELPAEGFAFDDQIVATSDPASNDPYRIQSLPPDPLDPTSCDAFEFRRRMRLMAGQPVVMQVKRSGGTVNLLVPPAFHVNFGMWMKMGPVTAIRKDSPAATVGVQPRDLISKVVLQDGAGKPIVAFNAFDPMRLPYELYRHASKHPNPADLRVVLSVLRSNPANHKELEERTLPPALWDASWDFNEEIPVGRTSPLSIPQLGLAYLVESTVVKVEEGSPAQAAGIQPHDRIDKVRFRSSAAAKTGAEQWGEWVELKSERPANAEAYDQWAHTFTFLQQDTEFPQMQVRVTRGGTLQPEVEIAGQADADWPLEQRGLLLVPETWLQKADNLPQALSLGVGRTVTFIKQIYLNLRGLLNRRISTKTLGGPIEIAAQAFAAAGESIWVFLLFLGIISVNLAVVNFLPIPILDGGHMVFLIYEKLRGQPPSESVRAAASYVGLFMLASLMLFVFYLDLERQGAFRGWWGS